MRAASLVALGMLVVTAAYQAGRYTSWILTVQGTLGASAVETHNILDATPKPHRQHRQREPSGILSRQPFRAAATIHLPHSVSNAVGNVAQGGKGITWPDITIISFTNMGMMDFALSWLHHLHIAIGKEEVAARLLMFVVGDEARKVLVQSGLCPERCIRDGAVGTPSLGMNAASSRGCTYNTPCFNKLAAQRPRILRAAIVERAAISQAVLYSDVDAVWRLNPLPKLWAHVGEHDVIGAQDTVLICTGFFMFSTRRPGVLPLLNDWDRAIAKGSKVNQYAFNHLLKKHSTLRVYRLEHDLFPSGMEFFHHGRHKGTALVVHANYFQGQDAKRQKLREAGLWKEVMAPQRPDPQERQEHEPEGQPQSPPTHSPSSSQAVSDITIISFANMGMIDFALNWLHHLRQAIGPEAVASSLLMYYVGAKARDAILASRLVPEQCLRDGGKHEHYVCAYRDGTVNSSGFDELDAQLGFKYQSPGFNKLAAQRPRIILHAINERRGASRAVLYSDVDAVWRRDPLPELRGLLEGRDIWGAQDTYLICTGFLMFSTGNAQVLQLLESWEMTVGSGDMVNQYAFNNKLKGYPQLRVYRLPHHLFPSGMEYFHKGRHKDTALVVHANYLQGQDVKRKKLQVAGLWATKPDLMLRPEQENLKPVAETVP